jgi:YVTN family beta-propeller protein
MIRSLESRFARIFAGLITSRYSQKQIPTVSVTVLLAIVTVVSLAGRMTALATSAGTVDAIYNFGANNFFVDPFQPYVYASSGASLNVINSSTLAVVQSIPLPATAYGMAMSPDGNKLYIAGGSSQSVFVLDTHTWTLLPSLSVADSPSDLAMGLSNRLFVLGGGISQIDATTGASTGPNVPVYFTYGGALRITPDRKTLFYADFGLSPGSLYKVDVSSTNPTVVWANGMDIGENGEQLALSHNGSMVAYVCGYGYQGYQIPNFRTSDMSLLGVFPTGAYPNALAYSPDDKFAYALHWIYPTAVDIYDLSSYARVGQFPIAGRSSIVTTDQSGQHLFVAFGQVIVYDTGRTIATNQPPVALCHDVTKSADSNCEATVTAADVNNGSYDPDGDAITLALNPAGPYPVGTNFVTLTVTDSHGASNSCTALVIVQDTTPPSITCPADLVVSADDLCAATGVNLGTPLVSDNCSAVTVTNNAPASFPIGTNFVTWTATDSSGNSTSCVQQIIVRDTTPPQIVNTTATPDMLWPPNHRMVPVTINVVATDNCDASPVARINYVRSNQSDAQVEQDWEITGPLSVNLRAERSANSGDRIYTIGVVVTDASGNSAQGTALVTVPHDASQINSTPGH